MKEKEEEQEGTQKEDSTILNNEGDVNTECDVNVDRAVVVKKRDTAFVNVRKKQIELYGNYYSAGLSDIDIIDWCNLEIDANNGLNENLRLLRSSTWSKIESEKQTKLALLAASLTEEEKEQFKLILG